ncbi:MAG: FAD-dependent oxidoreductase, partial [Brachymonas sp.]|nr:FAD-dependent oxidoreductase [Brachymonas sp.]
MSKIFDLIVIGAGPGGYIAAIRAAQLGKKVACIDAASNAEGKPTPGGTCTNVGCIPSKALLQSSEYFELAQKHFAEHGISANGVQIDVAAMVARKDKVVEQNNAGILYLFKKNKVQFFHGTGSFVAAQKEGGVDGYTIQVSPAQKDGAEETLFAPHIVIATGSQPRALPGAPFDEKFILSNTGALALAAVPQKLGVIGAGVIGLEMGSVWRRLGAEVTILEGLPDFLGAADAQIARDAKRAFDKQGLKMALGVKVGDIKVNPKAKSSAVQVAYTNAKGEAQTLEVDKLIVSIGRIPNTEGLNAEAVDLKIGERGEVVVNDHCQTNLPGVWAVGDVVRGPMLAHKA